MTNPIFQDQYVSDPDLDITNDSTVNFKDDEIALEKHLRGINTAVESIETINRLREVLLKNRNQKTSKSAAVLSKLAMENISHKLGVISNSDVLSIENMNNENSVEVCLEGFVDQIKRIWKTIMDTFRAIWTKITSFFKTSLNVDYSANAKKNQNIARDIIKDIQKGNLVPPADEKSYIVDNPHLSVLFFNSKDKPSDSDILSFIDDQMLILQTIDTFYKQLQASSFLAKNSAEQILAIIDEDWKTGLNKLMHLEEIVANMYTELMSFMKKDDCKDITDEVLRSINLYKRDINISNSSSLSGFLLNSKFYIFELNESSNRATSNSIRTTADYASLFYRDEAAKNSSNGKICIVNQTNLELINARVQALSTKFEQVKSDIRIAERSVWESHKEIDVIVMKIFDRLTSSDDQGAMSTYIRAIQNVLKSLVTPIAQMSLMVITTVDDSIRLLNSYNQTVNKWYTTTSKV